MRSALCVVSKDPPRRRHLDPEYELEPAESLYISRVDVGGARVGRDICIVVKEHRQPASKAVKKLADLPLKEFDDIAHVRDRQWSDDHGMGARLDRALEIVKRFSRRAARDPCPGLNWGKLPSSQIIVNPGHLVSLNPYQALSLGIADPVPFAVGSGRENNVRSQALLRVESKDFPLLGFNYAALPVQYCDARDAETSLGIVASAIFGALTRLWHRRYFRRFPSHPFPQESRV